jgi:hypothetical protein
LADPELDSLFHDLLASNRGPGYGISVIATAPDLSIIDVDLRFISGRNYCCAEPGCHLPSNTDRLVQLAADRSIHLPESLTIRWHCRVEQGAHLECLKSFGLLTETDAYEFESLSTGRAAS